MNRKTTPARPVRLLALGADYDFKAILGHVAAAQANITALVTSGHPPAAALLFDPALFPQTAPLTNPEDSLALGLVTHEHAPLDFVSMAEQCPFFRDAIVTGGKTNGQGLWNLSVLAATFCEKGEYIAHKISKEYPTYTREETNAMFDRKVAERDAKGLGWPSCQSFENEGSKFCGTCVHKGKIKSPLNLADPVKFTPPAVDNVTRQVKEGKIHPVVALKILHQRGASNDALFALMNENHAVVRYGSEIMVAAIIGNNVISMTVENFHKMFANVRIKVGDDFVEVSRLWFKWPGRRQYLDRGIVFEPGGPPDVADDMLRVQLIRATRRGRLQGRRRRGNFGRACRIGWRRA